VYHLKRVSRVAEETVFLQSYSENKSLFPRSAYNGNGLFCCKNGEGKLNTLVQYTTDYYHSDRTAATEWYALYVRSKHEFIVHEGLLRKRIETFLPALHKHRQWKDRKKVINSPLFPGYLFVK
jgi:hypothetical protein